MTPFELTGRARSHVVAVADPDCLLHKHVVAPFLALRRAAAAAGFDLRAASHFRDFERQLAIWNGKFSGTRPLLDAAGQAMDSARLTVPERIAAILRWSALPGASRHHWGTDVDLFDARAVPADYRVGLTSDEYTTGPFRPITAWLAANAARFGFFRPFRGERSGVQAELWHYSFAPLAESARRALTPAVLEDAIGGAPLLGKEAVLRDLAGLHARYVDRIDLP